MSNTVWDSIDPVNTSGTELAALLDDFKNAVMSGMSGTSRPTQLTEAGAWVDTTNEGSPNFYWSYKMWTGTADIEVFRINLATGTASIAGSDSTFQVTRISADSVGAILKLMKERIANSGQTLEGDVIGELQFIGSDNANGNPIICRIKAVASDPTTPTASGGYLVFEATTDAGATLSEMMRLVDGKLGVGTTAPEATIHAKGTGIKSERAADDALAAKLMFRKRRLAGTGASQSGDLLAQMDIGSTDNASAEAVVARMEFSAAENHTAAAQGTKMSYKAMKVGGNTLFEHFTVTDYIETLSLLQVNALKLVQQSIATAATIAALNADKAIVNFTGSTATIVQGISATGVSKTLLLYNGSSVNVTVDHENVTASAANRISLPKNRAIILQPGQAVELFYNTVSSRWTLKSGSGGGGGDIVVQTAVSVTAGGTIAISTTDPQQIIKITGSSGPQTASVTPFGNSFAPDGPVAVTLIGEDDANPVTLLKNDADWGCIGNFDDVDGIQISKSMPAKAVWYPATKRFYVMRGV